MKVWSKHKNNIFGRNQKPAIFGTTLSRYFVIVHHLSIGIEIIFFRCTKIIVLCSLFEFKNQLERPKWLMILNYIARIRKKRFVRYKSVCQLAISFRRHYITPQVYFELNLIRIKRIVVNLFLTIQTKNGSKGAVWILVRGLQIDFFSLFQILKHHIFWYVH